MRQGADQTEQIDWSRREVLVGVLHGARQLEANLAHRFYHMPAKLLPVPVESIGCVALYQSRRYFGSAAGVRMYGEVRAARIVPRSEIIEIPKRQNGQELYCRFEIEDWKTLPRPIRAMRLAPGVGMCTHRWLIENSSVFPELYIRSREQLAIYLLLRGGEARTLAGGSERLPAKPGYTALISGRVIGIYRPDGGYEEHNLRDCYQNPCSFLDRMGRILATAGEGENKR